MKRKKALLLIAAARLDALLLGMALGRKLTLAEAAMRKSRKPTEGLPDGLPQFLKDLMSKRQGTHVQAFQNGEEMPSCPVCGKDLNNGCESPIDHLMEYTNAQVKRHRDSA